MLACLPLVVLILGKALHMLAAAHKHHDKVGLYTQLLISAMIPPVGCSLPSCSRFMVFAAAAGVASGHMVAAADNVVHMHGASIFSQPLSATSGLALT